MKKNYFKRFVFVLIALTLLRLFLLGAFNLVPQEAYYWLYIQRPALSYFDHPPICSYSIGIFTRLFGDTEFGVRFGMLLYSIGTGVFVFLLAKKFFNSEKMAFLAYIFLNLTIFFNLHSIVATPDAPLLFFWSGAMYFFYRAIFEGDKLRDWILAGIFSGFALASKYTAVFLFINLFLFFLLSKDWNKIFYLKFLLSVLIAMIIFSPVILWNIQNGFASFLFQTTGRAKGIRSLGLNYFFQLVASQLYELTPLFFIMLIAVFFELIRKFNKLENKTLFLFSFSFPVVIFFFTISYTTLVKMNWILPAYLAYIILAVDIFDKSLGFSRKLVKFLGFPSSVALIIFNLLIILIPIFPIEKGDSWTGWRELGNRVTEMKRSFDRHHPTFIFSNEYKIPAELAFYTPFKDVILAENVYGRPALQFDLWFDVNKFYGWNAIFVYSDYNPSVNLDEIQKYFDRVDFVEELKIVKKEKVFRRFYIYHCLNYKAPRKQ
ncbi:MAG: ArnT family glycosyltransferase [Candidatus Kapaibacteriota bacterium]